MNKKNIFMLGLSLIAFSLIFTSEIIAQGTGTAGSSPTPGVGGTTGSSGTPGTGESPDTTATPGVGGTTGSSGTPGVTSPSPDTTTGTPGVTTPSPDTTGIPGTGTAEPGTTTPGGTTPSSPIQPLPPAGESGNPAGTQDTGESNNFTFDQRQDFQRSVRDRLNDIQNSSGNSGGGQELFNQQRQQIEQQLNNINTIDRNSWEAYQRGINDNLQSLEQGSTGGTRDVGGTGGVGTGGATDTGGVGTTGDTSTGGTDTGGTGTGGAGGAGGM